MGEWSIAESTLNLGVDRSEWSVSGPGCFASGEGAVGMRCVGDWMVPTIRLNLLEKRKISFLCRESNTDSSAVYFVT
jgi:hypothetical protein